MAFSTEESYIAYFSHVNYPEIMRFKQFDNILPGHEFVGSGVYHINKSVQEFKRLVKRSTYSASYFIVLEASHKICLWRKDTKYIAKESVDMINFI